MRVEHKFIKSGEPLARSISDSTFSRPVSDKDLVDDTENRLECDIYIHGVEDMNDVMHFTLNCSLFPGIWPRYLWR